jgi:hypothetical protein
MNSIGKKTNNWRLWQSGWIILTLALLSAPLLRLDAAAQEPSPYDWSVVIYPSFATTSVGVTNASQSVDYCIVELHYNILLRGDVSGEPFEAATQWYRWGNAGPGEYVGFIVENTPIREVDESGNTTILDLMLYGITIGDEHYSLESAVTWTYVDPYPYYDSVSYTTSSGIVDYVISEPEQ